MTTLPKTHIINRIMLYVSHLVADIFKPLIICLELGIIIDANRQSFWLSYSGNPTIEEGVCKLRVSTGMEAHMHCVIHVLC